MEIIYLPKAEEDLIFWKKSGNIAVKKKIEKLIEEIQINPFSGIGKPEQLRFQLAGKWSRRINKEHRIVYELFNESIFIHSLKDHY